MKIDKNTLLISDFTEEEEDSMLEWARSVLLGPCPPLHEEAWPQWLKLWFEASGFNDRQGLMVMSALVPARVLLSLNAKLIEERNEARWIAEEYRDDLTIDDQRPQALPWEIQE